MAGKKKLSHHQSRGAGDSPSSPTMEGRASKKSKFVDDAAEESSDEEGNKGGEESEDFSPENSQDRGFIDDQHVDHPPVMPNPATVFPDDDDDEEEDMEDEEEGPTPPPEEEEEEEEAAGDGGVDGAAGAPGIGSQPAGYDDLKAFRNLLADPEGMITFITDCKTFSEERIMEIARMLKVGIVEAHPACIMEDIFKLYKPELNPFGDEDDDARHATCWKYVNCCDSVPLVYEALNKSNLAVMSRLHGLIAQMEEVGPTELVGDVTDAVGRVFTMREAVCCILEARLPQRERESLLLSKLIVRLSHGSAELNDLHRLMVILTAHWHHMGYRKGEEDSDDGVYVREFTPEGHDTHYWKKVTTIKKWVREMTSPEYPIPWKICQRDGSTCKKATEHIMESAPAAFPVRPKDRHVFAFRNGIYRADTDEFFPYDGPRKLPSDVGACRYFPDAHVPPEFFEEGAFRGEFEDGEWVDIPCEPVSTVLEFQGYSRNVQKTFWALAIGRMLYNLKELDMFEVMVFLKGMAGSGKSTLINIMNLIYGPEVGVLSNNIESMFGLSKLKDKYANITVEIDERFKLTQSDWLSMVSGERISMAVKHGDPITEDWRPPLLAAGNKMFWTSDNASQISRRLVLFPFDKKPEEPDATLAHRMKANVAAIIVKGNRAYRALVRAVGSRSVHKYIDPQFTEWRRQAAESSSLLITFLNSVSWVERGEECYMPWDLFEKKFTEWAGARDKRKTNMDEDYYKYIFAEFNIRVVKDRTWKNYPRNSNTRKRAIWLYGVDFNFDEEEAGGV